MRKLILSCIVFCSLSSMVSAQEDSIAHLGIGYQHVSNYFQNTNANINYIESYHFLAVNLFAVKSSFSGFYISVSALFPLSLDSVQDSIFTDRSLVITRSFGLDGQFGYLIKVTNSPAVAFSFGAGIDYLGLLCRADHESQDFSQIGLCALINLEIKISDKIYFTGIVDSSLFFFPLAGSVSYLRLYSIGWGIKSVIGVGYRF